MKFEPWILDPKIIEVSDDRNNRIGFIHNPSSSQAVFLSVGRGSEIDLDGVREILASMEATTAEQEGFAIYPKTVAAGNPRGYDIVTTSDPIVRVATDLTKEEAEAWLENWNNGQQSEESEK